MIVGRTPALIGPERSDHSADAAASLSRVHRAVATTELPRFEPSMQAPDPSQVRIELMSASWNDSQNRVPVDVQEAIFVDETACRAPAQP